MKPVAPRRFVAWACVLAGLLALAAGMARAAEPADAPLLAAARAEAPALVATLRELVGIESASHDAEGLARITALVEQRLQALGLRTERIPGAGGRGEVLRGTLEGRGSRSVLLLAHLDTVYPRGTLAAQPLREEGGRLHGPGVGDDKGGVALILHTLALLQKTRLPDLARLTVLFNADEEIGSRGSGDVIARVAAEHDVVYSCEPGGSDSTGGERLALGAAGTASVRLTVHGRAAHAGGSPGLGRNALLELSHQILQSRDVAEGIPGAQFQWTTARAGTVSNQVPPSATATADVRLLRPEAGPALEAALRARIGATRLVPDTTAEVTFTPGRPPFVASDAARALATRAQAVYAELDGRRLVLVPMIGGSTDAGYAARSGRAVVLEGFGLAGAGYHAPGEFVELDSVAPRLYLLARMIDIAARP